jgi:hypothetical protein
MTPDELASVTLEHLRAIRADLVDVKREVANNSLQIGLLGQQIGALTTAVYSGKSELEDIKRRVDRIEQRLNLVDAPH